MPAPGDTILNKYKVEKVIGQGGMGYVVLAQHIQLGNKVAMKFMAPHIASIPEAKERFLREARIAASLSSENVVRVLDVDEDDRGTPFMAMEHLDGISLEKELKKTGPLPITVAVSYALQVCEGLAEAHGKGIVHRDLKPANFFLTSRWGGKQIIKILDFGISKATAEGQELTGTGFTLGSPKYSAPEQLTSSRAVDGRADVWSLGVCLYEFLTGVLPFEADHLAEVLRVVRTAEPISVEALRSDVPPTLAAIVKRCLQKQPDARFQTAEELRAALLPFADETFVAISAGSMDAPKTIPHPQLATHDDSLSADFTVAQRVKALSPATLDPVLTGARRTPTPISRVLIPSLAFCFVAGTSIWGINHLRERGAEHHSDEAVVDESTSSTIPEISDSVTVPVPSASTIPVASTRVIPSAISTTSPTASVRPIRKENKDNKEIKDTKEKKKIRTPNDPPDHPDRIPDER